MISPNWYPTTGQLRQFAVISLVGFGLVGVLFWRWTASAQAAAVCGLIGAGVFLVGVPFPGAVRPVYVLLTAVALPIGWLVSQVLLRVVFYGVLTPLGILLKMTGRDPLRLRRPQLDSYWQKHEAPADPISYFRQT